MPSGRPRPELGPVGTRPSVAPPGLSLPNLPRDDASTMDLAQLTSRGNSALSPELEELLSIARDRVGAEEETDREDVREEIEDVLPSEILASLDEPEPPQIDEESSLFPSAAPVRGRTNSEITGADPVTGTGRTITGAREQTGPGRTKSDSGPRTDPGSEVSRLRTSDLVPPRAPSVGSPTMVAPPSATPAPPSVAPVVSIAPVAHLPSNPPSLASERPPTVRGPTPELAFEKRFSQLAPPIPANEGFDGRLVGRASDPSKPSAPKNGVPRATFALAILDGMSGQVAVESTEGARYAIFEGGDLVTAASDIVGEDLIGYLASTGVLSKPSEERLRGRIPAYGKRAGAALVAHGELSQDELWSVLRGYAEWVLARIMRTESAMMRVGEPPLTRFAAEPSVFGGATGAHVYVEAIRRTVTSARALQELGTPDVRLVPGERYSLLRECGLLEEDEALVREAEGRPIGDILARRDFEFASVLLALRDLGVCRVDASLVLRSHSTPPTLAPPTAQPAVGSVANSPNNAAAQAKAEEALVRARVAARLALVEEGDYFAILGVSPDATGYEIRRAFLGLRRGFDPHRLLSPASFDLAGDVKTITLVLEEAYEILRDPVRRDRYRTALFARDPG